MATKKNNEERKKKSADEINLGVKDKRGNHEVFMRSLEIN